MLDFLLHLEQSLPLLLEQYGVWIYAILFLVIFAETGSPFFFFLPGDSLLIAVGALCSSSDLITLHSMGLLLLIASILGYTVNYYSGRVLGLKYFNEHSRFFKPEYMVKTNHYFMKHGGKTILIARFIPFVRSFGPFAAGSGHMSFVTFSFYNVTGGILWISTLLGAGYLLGNTAFLLADLF